MLFWPILGYFGLFWVILGYFDDFSRRSVYGLFWYFRVILVNRVISAISGHYGSFRVISGHFGLFRVISGHFLNLLAAS